MGSSVLVTACASSAAPDALEFQTGLSASDPTLDVLADITEICTPKGITVNLVPQTNTYEADMRTRLASNDVPDLWSTHGWSLHRYGPFLEPLSNQPWAGDLAPALESVMLDDDGSLYALPVNADVAGIVYNRDVTDDLGIDVTDLTTWADFREAMETAKRGGVTPLGSSSKDSWMAGNVADFMMSGAYDDDALAELLSGTFASDGYATVLDEIDRWREAGYFNPDFSSASIDDLARSVATKDTAFVFVQNYFVSTVLSFDPDADVGFFPVPSFTGDPYLLGGEGTAFGVSASSPQKDKALEYLDCLAEPDQLSLLAASLGSIPGLDGVPATPGPLQDSLDAWLDTDPVEIRPYFDRVYLPGGIWDTMVTTTSAVITGQTDIAAALDQVERQFDALVGQ